MAKFGDFGGKFIRCERSFADRFAKISFGNDRIDAQALCQRLDRCVRGNRKAFSVVRAPTAQECRTTAEPQAEPQARPVIEEVVDVL